MNKSVLNNSSTNASSVASPPDSGSDQGQGEPIVAAILVYLPIAARFGVIPALDALSFLSSVVNVITFAKMDLSQGVTQNLFVLSVADFAVAVISIIYGAGDILARLGYRHQLQWLLYFSLYALNYPLYVSLIITTIIAVVRCCSVAIPLSFRRIFTARRQLAAILCSSSIMAVILSYPLGYSLSLSYFRTIDNQTSTFVFVERKGLITMFNLFRNVLFYTCLAINLVAMFFLIRALRKSSQFQRLASSTAASLPAHLSSQPSVTARKSTNREARVIKTTILVLAILVACYLPLILLSVLRLTVPGFAVRTEYLVWRTLLDIVVAIGLHLNVGLNSFVYYNCNSQFRQIVRTMFTVRKKENARP